MPELQFEPSTLPAPAELELFTTEEAMERINRLQAELNAEQAAFMAERSSYGLQKPNLQNWLQTIDAVEPLVNRFNVACVRLLRALKELAANKASDPKKTTVEQKAMDTQVAEQVARIEQQRHRIGHQMQLIRIEAKAHLALEPAPGHAIAMAGWIKSDWLKDKRYQQHRLGFFGQDVLLVDRHKGSAVVADGAEAMPDSYSVAKVTAQACEEVLANAPEELATDLDELRWYTQSAADTISTALEGLPATTIGSTAVLAARYFRKFDALMIIEIGDCEAALATADAAQRISYTVPRRGDVPHIRKIPGQAVTMSQPPGNPLVRLVSVAEFRQAHPNQPIHLVGGSDGLRNNSGLPLEQHAGAIVRAGIQATLDRYNQPITADLLFDRRDDMTLFDLELKAVAG